MANERDEQQEREEELQENRDDVAEIDEHQEFLGEK